jgi:release factor glutamine methyltransferase
MIYRLAAVEYKDILQQLNSIMDKYQAEAELGLILEHVGFEKKLFWLGKTPSKEQTQKINDIIEKRLQNRIPLQHILGYGYFMGEKFKVSKDVLIPRPETELLVQNVAELNGNNILDIGTGSGCIAIMLQKITNKAVSACDISKKAINIARENAKNLNANVTFIESDLFQNIHDKFDIIVSNPPYIPLSEHHALTPEVKEHEPNNALFAPDEEGIEFYQKIIEASNAYLNPQGYLAFEIGIGQSEAIKNLLQKNNFEDIKVIKDFAKIDRIIIAKAEN